MSASRIFRNFLNVSQTTENTDLDSPLTPEETTQVIGYLNFHYGCEDHVVRAMFGTPGLIPKDFVDKYDPDLHTSVAEVSEFLGTLTQEDVGDFLKAVAEHEHEPKPEPALADFEFLNRVEKPTLNNSVRTLKKFKGK